MSTTSGRRLPAIATRAGLAVALVAAALGTLGMNRAPATAGQSCADPTVTRQAFGSAFDSYVNASVPVDRYTLTNCHGVQTNILTYFEKQRRITAATSCLCRIG